MLGEENVPFPEDGYHGDDIKELARAFLEQHGPEWKDKSEEERQEAMAQFGLSINIPKMKEDLLRYKIEYDEWFLESALHNSGYVAETVGLLADKGWTYEKDGALWLNTTALLKQKYLGEGKTQEQVDKLDLKDDVLRRANGFYTYFAADIAYHRNKLEKRGFSKDVYKRQAGNSGARFLFRCTSAAQKYFLMPSVAREASALMVTVNLMLFFSEKLFSQSRNSSTAWSVASEATILVRLSMKMWVMS